MHGHLWHNVNTVDSVGSLECFWTSRTKHYCISPWGNMNVPNESPRCQLKLHTHFGASRKVRGSPKWAGLILWTPWLSFTKFHGNPIYGKNALRSSRNLCPLIQMLTLKCRISNVMRNKSLSCYLAGASGTLLKEWSCLLLSLFVSHYCPPAAHSQWEPRPVRSSSSSPPSLLFKTPIPFLGAQNMPWRKAFFMYFFFGLKELPHPLFPRHRWALTHWMTCTSDWIL